MREGRNHDVLIFLDVLFISGDKLQRRQTHHRLPSCPVNPHSPIHADSLIQGYASSKVDEVEQAEHVRHLPGHFLGGFLEIGSRFTQRKGELGAVMREGDAGIEVVTVLDLWRACDLRPKALIVGKKCQAGAIIASNRSL